MSEPARDLLDIAVAEFKRQRGKDAVDENQSAYQTLYWLFRWSGVINYAALAAFDAKETT